MTRQARNPVTRDVDTYIDCEILHLEHGWIPHTTKPSDHLTQKLYHELKNGDWGPITILDPLTSEEILQRQRALTGLPKDAFILALYNAGLLQAAKNAVTQSDTAEEYKIYWQYSIVIGRTSPLVTFLTNALGVTEQQVDNVFGITS